MLADKTSRLHCAYLYHVSSMNKTVDGKLLATLIITTAIPKDTARRMFSVFNMLKQHQK